MIIGPRLPKITGKETGPFVALDHCVMFGISRSRTLPAYDRTDILSHASSHALSNGILPRVLMDIISPHVSGILPLSLGLTKVRNYEATRTCA